MDFPAEARYLSRVRRALQQWLADIPVEEAAAFDIVLAVAEACTNAVEHGHREDGGTVAVAAEVDGEHIRVTVADRGSWKPPDHDAESLRGRGMDIMRALSTRFRVASSDSGTVVEMLLARG
ncbi:ATP-binding protein [Nocardia thailandica]|uniref:ATP-binding protein n=1 Tax=Nocardia thailandica TaxID=257275 RepID=A0ABW6PWA0_9NOCA